MPAPTGPTFVVDIYNCTATPVSGSGTAVNIFAVKSVNISRKANVFKGKDNLHLRPVSTHILEYDETVTIDTEDVNAYNSLLSATGGYTLTFNGRTAAHNYLGANELPDQTYTVGPVVFDAKDFSQPMKQGGTYKIVGFTVEPSGGDTVDTISVTAATSPVSDAQN